MPVETVPLRFWQEELPSGKLARVSNTTAGFARGKVGLCKGRVLLPSWGTQSSSKNNASHPRESRRTLASVRLWWPLCRDPRSQVCPAHGVSFICTRATLPTIGASAVTESSSISTP